MLIVRRPVEAVLGFILLCLAALPLEAQTNNANDILGGASNRVEFLPVEKAYQLSPSVAAGRVLLDWAIAPDYFLYRERIKVDAASSAGVSLPVVVTMKTGKSKYDEIFERDTEIYYDQTQVIVTFPEVQTDPFTLAVEFQGCADAGLCYPPQKQYFQIDPVAGTAESVAGVTGAAGTARPAEAAPPAQLTPNLLVIFLMALA
ncbi:MAG TPA: protein-disulfide reductase DsbD N-terminal domain-containing protein, partial [Pseudomonadales bacterium]|nr:protein-disulfide reductase DsbD N-terminal domain-containing protein [Pseudomonadales bacterium]